MRKNRILLLLLLLVSLFTLAACQGEAGVAGEKGPQGDKGLTGDTGATGDKGADGQNSKAPEFKVDNDGLQWRYEGEEEWNVIVTIPDLIGYSEKYTFTFNANGGEAVEPLANQVWKTTAQLPEATKEGYTFLGWQSLEEGAQEGDVYAENKYPNVQGDVELTAVWGSTVSYAEETGKESVVLKAGEKTTLPAMEAPEGKTFLGWSYDGYTLEQAAAEITPDGDRHYAPIYEYTITYELNGGVGEATEEVKTAEIGELPVPTKVGYAFKGWFEDAELTVAAPSKPVGDTTLYAKWMEVTYVNYDLNGGTIAVAPYASIDAFAEEIVTLFKEAGGEVTTREEFQSLSHPNVKNVFSKAENLQKYQWLIQLALDAVNESGLADDETYGSGQTIASYKEMLTAMLNGDTNAINGSYADGRSAFRQFIHRLINKDNAEAKGNTAYNTVTTDFAVAENLAKVNEIMGLPAPKYADLDACIADLVADLSAFYGKTLTATTIGDGSYGAAVNMPDFFYTHETYSPKWQWLAEYMIATKKSQGMDAATLESKDVATWRFEVNSFTSKSVRTSWPASSDYSKAEIAATWAVANGSVKQVIFEENGPLATPTRKGYVFAGWFDAQEQQVTNVTVGGENNTVNVKAKWTVATTVTYNFNGGANTYADITAVRQDLCDDYNAFAGKSYTLATMPSGSWSPVDFHTWFASEGMTAKWGWLAEWMAANGGRTSTDRDNAQAFQKMLDGKSLNPDTDIYSISYEFRAFVLGSVIRKGHASFGSTEYDEATLAEIWTEFQATHPSEIAYTEGTSALAVAVKPGYAFLGWYDANDQKVEAITVGTEPAFLELTAKYSDTVVDPQEGVAYKLGIAQNNLSKTLYLNGQMSGYYAATTETKADAVDVYFEAVEGGYNVYFMSGEAKKYINIEKSGTHLNIKFQDAASTVWAMDETYPTLVTTVETEKCYMGTYGTYNTFSCSKYSYAATSFPSFICE